MLLVKRFDSFSSAQMTWQSLEQQVNHYPFQAFWYQKLFAEAFCSVENVYLLAVYDSETLLAIGGFESTFAKATVSDAPELQRRSADKKVLFLGMKQVLGGQDLTDYGDILFAKDVTDEQVKKIWQTISEYFKDLKIKQLQLDYVREDSKTYSVIASSSAAISLRAAQTTNNGIAAPVPRLVRNDGIKKDKQEVAPFLIVPNSWEGYLQSLSRKERHELKRKIKRFEEQNAFHFCSKDTLENDFQEFIRLHRLSDPAHRRQGYGGQAKEKFMSEEMKDFFWNIVQAEKEDYRIDFCFLKMDGKNVASIMSFICEGKALLYNSGFDPEYAYYSVGLILHAYLIKKSIEEKLHIHDFMRGNERYKYDLGAQDSQLYKIVITLK